MKNVFKDHVNFLIMIAMALAMAMFSCSSDSDDAPPSPVLSTVSSSSGVSSSSAPPEPSVPDGAVKIGNQIWKKENLNIDADGSKCYDNDPANCTKYGRLYDWATAMNLPANCNSETCASLIAAKHRGLCPAGWHIPSNAEWDALMTAVGGASTASKKLKAADGWNSGGNGDGSTGFAALPGGYGGSVGSFFSVGSNGDWWSASENNSRYAYYRNINYNLEYLGRSDYVKSFLFSVRCLQD